MKAANIDLDRKVLADIAAQDSATFQNLIEKAQAALQAKAAA